MSSVPRTENAHEAIFLAFIQETVVATFRSMAGRLRRHSVLSKLDTLKVRIRQHELQTGEGSKHYPSVSAALEAGCAHVLPCRAVLFLTCPCR